MISARIPNIISRPDWIKNIGSLLHDSLIEEERFDDQANVFMIRILRICWENNIKRFLRHDHLAVPAEIVITWVKNIEKIPRKPSIAEGEPQVFLGIKKDVDVLELNTSFGSIRLILNPESSLEVRDVGKPSSKGQSSCLISCVINKKQLEELMNTLSNNSVVV
jgi:hypothetical protein